MTAITCITQCEASATLLLVETCLFAAVLEFEGKENHQPPPDASKKGSHTPKDPLTTSTGPCLKVELTACAALNDLKKH